MKGKKQLIGPVTKTFILAVIAFLGFCILQSCKDTTTPGTTITKQTDQGAFGLNIQVSGAYGETNYAIGLLPNAISVENTTYSMSFKAYHDRLFAKAGNTIYEIIDSKPVELYQHDVQVHSLVGVSDDFVLFDAPGKKENEPESYCDYFWIYYLSTGETRLLTATDDMSCFYENNELIITNLSPKLDGTYQIFTNLDGEITEQICSGVEELPKNYKVTTHGGFNFFVIEKKKADGSTVNTLLTDEELDYSGQVVQRGQTTSQHRGNVAYKNYLYSQKADKTTVYNVSRHYKSHWDDLLSWEGDNVEKYDLVNKTGTILYEDKQNAIIGFNYAENIVYQVTSSDYKLMAKTITGPDTWTELAQLKQDTKVVFIWSGQYLFWKYVDDEKEEFGGVLKL